MAISRLTVFFHGRSFARMKPAEELRNDIRRAAAMNGCETQAALAGALAITPAYVNDILRLRKRLTPQLVDRAGKAFSIHPIRYRRWHRLGAMESGWDIDSREDQSTGRK